MVETTIRRNTTIIYSESRINKFISIGKTVGKMQVFRDKSKKVRNILDENIQNIHKIGERYRADACITCSNTYFKHIICNTKAHEIEVGIFITECRKIVHYAVFGFEPTVLLLALDE